MVAQLNQSTQNQTDPAALALARLAQSLKYPDDLNSKLENLRKKIAAEKAAVDNQLKAATQTQLNDCDSGLQNLKSVLTDLGACRDELEGVHHGGVKSLSILSNFHRIQKLSTIHRNFQSTRRTLLQFQELNERVDRLGAAVDAAHRDILGPARDLLSMHHELFCLAEFQEETLVQVKDASKETQAAVGTYFQRLDDLNNKFADYFWDLARNVIELGRSGNRPAVVRLAKVLEFEERADEEVLAEQERDAADQADTARARANSQLSMNRIGGVIKSAREIKSYRSKFFDVLHDGIASQFTRLYTPDIETSELLTKANEMVVSDLLFVVEEMVDLFPRKYKIFPFFVLEYHRHVYDLVNKIILDKMETGTILFVLRWCREYYVEMNDKLGISEELLEPRLLEGQEPVLIEDYLKLVRQKLDEWMKNLLNSETREFVERAKPPETDSQGMYGLSAAVILFNMVNQQIDIVLESSRGQLLLDVVKDCKRILLVYQAHFQQLVTAEYTKFVQLGDKANPGLIEYTMALANDSLKCTEFVELIVKRLENLVEPAYQQVVTNELNAAMDGFMKVSKAACAILIDSAFADVKSAFSLLFTLPAWYEGEIMNDIVATLNDYCVDYQEHLQEYLFGKMTSDMMERFLISWIESLKSKNSKFRVPRCMEIMEADLQRVIQFFGQFKSQKRAEKHFDVIDKLAVMISANRKMVFVDFYALWKQYNDIPLSLVEDLLAKRDDMDKATLRELMDAIRQKTREEMHIGDARTIFSAMAAQSASSK